MENNEIIKENIEDKVEKENPEEKKENIENKEKKENINEEKKENKEKEDKKENSETSSELSHISAITTSVGSEETLCNYNHFVNEIKNSENMLNPIKWESEERTEEFNLNKNNKKIIKKELQQIDYKDPFSIISPLYQKYNYSISLFEKEITEINDFDNNEETMMNLIERRENLELMKKIIQYYINYIISKVEKHMNKILENINPLNENLIDAYFDVKVNKGKLGTLKRYFLRSSSQLIIKKIKMKNILNCLKFIREVLIDKYYKVKEMKIRNKSYMEYYKDNILLQNKLGVLEDQYPKFKIFEILAQKLKEKNIKFNKRFQHDIDRLFDEKKSNFYELFCLFSISGDISDDEAIDAFAERMKLIFKKKVKETIIQSLYQYSLSKDKIPIENIKKIVNLYKLEFNEYDFTDGFKNCVLELKELCEIFLFYANVKEK